MRKALDGLVIRETETGESDKLLTVLTAKEGKIPIIAKGVRSPRGKNFALCRAFTYANFEYYEKNGRRWLAGGSVNDSFFGLSGDLAGFALAAYIVDVAGELTGEGVPDEEMLRAALNTLYAITKKIKPLPQIKAAFEFFAAKHAGFCPDLSGCGECGKEAGETFLDVMNGALVCAECFEKNPLRLRVDMPGDFSERRIILALDAASLDAARYATEASVRRLFAFELKSEKSIALFSEAAEKYLLNHLERGFETLKFYRSVI